MKKELLREIGADSLPELLKKANAKGIKKEQYLEIVELRGTYHLIYASR